MSRRSKAVPAQAETNLSDLFICVFQNLQEVASIVFFRNQKCCLGCADTCRKRVLISGKLEVADGNEDHSHSYPERIGSKESTGSNGRCHVSISNKNGSNTKSTGKASGSFLSFGDCVSMQLLFSPRRCSLYLGISVHFHD